MLRAMSHILRSKRLEIRIREPGEIYRASRFDWSTNVDSIILDGKHQFASTEILDSAKARVRGGGLHSEFGIRGALGYESAKIGERFGKIGVGFIRREDSDPYDFYRLYEDIEPTPNKVREINHDDGEELEISGATALHQKFGWKLVRRYRVASHSLTVKTELTNTGTEPILTSEYCHNFLKLGEKNVGPDYALSFDFPLSEQFEDVNDKSRVLEALPGKTPRFIKEPANDPGSQFWVGSLLPAAPSLTEKMPIAELPQRTQWTLRDSETGLSASERLDGPCLRVDMWGRRYVCSVELFARIDLRPGERQTWSRHYVFDDKHEPMSEVL